MISNALKEKCKTFLEKTTLPQVVKKMTEVLERELNNRFQKIEDNQIFAQSTVLDPRFKKHGFQNPIAYNRACTMLKDFAGRISSTNIAESEPNTSLMPPPPKKFRSSIWDSFDQKISEVLSNTNPIAGGIVEVDKYLEEPILPRHMDPLKWWLKKKDVYPRLYEIVLRRLCVSATSVPSERVFSKAGQILVERRNRLSGKKVSQLLFLKNNM